MGYELRKLLSSPLLAGMFFILLLINGVLFYWHCTDDSDGYTYSQIAEKYSVSETLETEMDALMNAIWNDIDDSISLSTGNVYEEYDLDRAVMERIQEAEEYDSYLSRIQFESSAKIQLGIFGDENSFEVRSMEKAIQVYHALEGTPVTVAPSVSIETLVSWRLTNLFVLLIATATGLLLITSEHMSGILTLLRPTKHGKERLYFNKFAAMGIAVAASTLLMYGTDIGIASFLFGMGDLNRPIQSCYGFQSCPMALTVLEYLLCSMGVKLLWAWAIGAVCFFLSIYLKQSVSVIVSWTGVGALAYLLACSNSPWLRGISLLWLSNTENLFLGCIYINFCSIPVRQALVGILFLINTIFLSFLVGMKLFCQQSTVSTNHSISFFASTEMSSHTNLLRHEAYKAFIVNGTLVVLLLFLIIQCISYKNAHIQMDEQEYYYRYYSEELSGKQTEQKLMYLKDETDRFETLKQQMAYYYSIAEGNGELYNFLTTDLDNQLRAEDGFEKAKEQYGLLQPEEAYIYASGYERLFGMRGFRDTLINTFKLAFVLVVCLSSTFSVEYETGVEIFLKTYGREKQIRYQKILLVGMILMIAELLAYLPQYIVIGYGYGYTQLTERVSSLAVFSALPGWLPIWSVFGIAVLCQLTFGIILSVAILLLSAKTRNTIRTILISEALLLLPIVVWILLL